MHSLTAFYLNQTVNFPCLFFSCDYCTKSELSFDQMDDQDMENYWQHWLDKEEAALAREEDHKDDAKTVVTFDLQQILPIPKLKSTKQSFYRTRMHCYNLCFYVKNKKQGYCYMWSQVEGGRGSNEIATCLRRFVDEHLTDSRHIVFYSDGCPGQNKNSAVVAVLAHMAHNSQPGQVIDLKFFATGHSHMEVDSVHAAIERASHGVEIGTPGDWIQLFQSAKKTGDQPYICEELDHSLFVDWKEVARAAFKTNALEGISAMHWISARNVEGKLTLLWGEGVLGPLYPIEWRSAGGQFGWNFLPRAYQGRLKLPKKKYDDSSAMVPLLRNKTNAQLYFRDVRELVSEAAPQQGPR